MIIALTAFTPLPESEGSTEIDRDSVDAFTYTILSLIVTVGLFLSTLIPVISAVLSLPKVSTAFM